MEVVEKAQDPLLMKAHIGASKAEAQTLLEKRATTQQWRWMARTNRLVNKQRQVYMNDPMAYHPFDLGGR